MRCRCSAMPISSARFWLSMGEQFIGGVRVLDYADLGCSPSAMPAW